jgi:transcriptional regulator with XRE-family HTH domain
MRPSTNPILLQALGAALKERRNELGLSQEDVAGAAGIDRPYVTLIEAARKQPTISVLWRLAVAIDLTPQDFAGRIERFNQELQRVADGSSSG